MKKMKKNTIALTLALSLFVAAVLGTSALPTQVHAASKKAYYGGTLLQTDLGGCNAYVTSVKIKGKKLIVKGTLHKAASEKGYIDGRSTLLKCKKRTFKMTGSCKFYSRGGEDPDERMSKSEFLSVASQYSGLWLCFYTNKSGKVTKIVISS